MDDPKKKMEILKQGLEAGIIKKDEYETEKSKLEPEVKKFEKKAQEMQTEKEIIEYGEKTSDRALIISLAIIIILFVSVLAYSVFFKQQPKTLEDLHKLNLEGKLNAKQGYIYKGVYSFVTLDNLWYTQLKSPKGTKEYDLALRYSPKDIEGIQIDGSLNSNLFDEKNEYYVTFNPTGMDFSYVALAVADFNTHMSKVFEKNPIAACDRNETIPCISRPIVTCDDKDKLVLYVREADRFRAYYNDNCIVVEGLGLDLVKGVDRILYDLYGIIKK